MSSPGPAVESGPAIEGRQPPEPPPPSLFGDERVLRWTPAIYLPSREYPRPGARTVLDAIVEACRQVFMGRPWLIHGNLWLTTRRVIFEAGDRSDFRGHFSLFLCRLRVPWEAMSYGMGSYSGMQLCHLGAPGPEDSTFDFVYDEPLPPALTPMMHVYNAIFDEDDGPAEAREVFLQEAREAWPRLGLGLHSAATRAWVEGLRVDPDPGQTFRDGDEPPDLRLLRQRLRGLEGEAVAQLGWLFAPPAPAPRELIRYRSMQEAMHTRSTTPPMVRKGRPFAVQGAPRESPARRRGDWG